MTKTVDYTNRRFGLYTVLRLHPTKSGNKRVWECQCRCSKIRYVRSEDLRKVSGCSSCVAKERERKRELERQRGEMRRIKSRERMAKSRERERNWKALTNGELGRDERQREERRASAPLVVAVWNYHEPPPKFWALPEATAPHLAAWDDGEWVSIPLADGPCGVHPNATSWCPQCTKIQLAAKFLSKPQENRNDTAGAAHPWRRRENPLPKRIEAFRRRTG